MCPLNDNCSCHEDDEQWWWCDCPDRRGPHVHMPNWDANPKYGTMLTALVDTETGEEVPGSRR